VSLFSKHPFLHSKNIHFFYYILCKHILHKYISLRHIPYWTLNLASIWCQMLFIVLKKNKISNPRLLSHEIQCKFLKTIQMLSNSSLFLTENFCRFSHFSLRSLCSFILGPLSETDVKSLRLGRNYTNINKFIYFLFCSRT
jgi:hypothetical protein